MVVLRRETLISALQNVYGTKGLTRGDVLDLCDFVLDFFGYEDYVLDNVLSPPERDAFYDLEENGVLKTQAEEVTLSKGKVWRVNQWVFRRNKILQFAKMTIEEDGLEKKYEDIFKELENQQML
ncbi:MAG: DUF6015 family protein [Cuniculiplasma sp.]